jgi:tetratricopeptide (TPR) repeat protein
MKYALKDFQEAIQDFEKAIEIDPYFAKAYNNRGLVKFNLGDKNGACLDWNKADELGYVEAYDLIIEYCND